MVLVAQADPVALLPMVRADLEALRRVDR
jgi:hypothetical protein